MKIPKQISPDRIKDSIVEIRYSSKLPFEVAIGLFYKSLDDSYTYTNRPIGKQQIPTLFPSNLPQELTLSFGNQSLFFNDKIKIQLQPNSIVFNCLNDYVGWDNYKIEIEKVLVQLASVNVIDSFSRIGVRYISEYQNINLKDCVKFSFTFGMPDIQSDTYSFHSEFMFSNLKVLLNLNHKLPVVKSKNSTTQLSIVQLSVIDIDVIMENVNETDIEKFIKQIEVVHQKEKEVFFSLLKDDFLKTLNPVY